MARRLLAVSAALALAATVVATSPASAGGVAPYEKDWALLLDGWNRSSAPVIADIDADNQNEIVFGHQDGTLRAYEGDGTLKWSTPAVPSVGPGCNGQSGASAIDSSPAVADIDEDGTPEVIVGVGSTWAANQNGGVIAFNGKTGAKEWGTAIGRDTGNVWANSGSLDGWCEGVFSTPAIGDVDGDDDMEIFIGGDSTPGGYYDHLGGVFRALDWTPGGVVNLWNAEANEVFHSSPAIGDINNDGVPEAVIATGNNWHTECGNGHHQCSGSDGSDHSKVFAFHLHDGSTVPGFPVSTGGTVIGSPALGDLDNDGGLEVVIGSEDHYVYAWNGDGSLDWKVRPSFNHLGTGRMQGSPIIADLDGDGGQDVAIGGDKGLAVLDGMNGASLEDGIIWQDAMSRWSHESAPAVGVINGSRHIVFTSFDTPSVRTRLAAYELPNSSADDAWPMLRRDAMRQGSAETVACGFSVRGTFCDVSESAYYADAVAWMVDEGITNGITDLLYGPNVNLSRAQMVTFLWRNAGSPTGNPAHGFGDVPAGAYYGEAVAWAKAQGITTGTSATTFAPNQDVTRAQLVTLLWRMAGEPSAPAAGFADVPAGRYFSTAVAWAKQQEITTGTSAFTFSPDNAVTRGQAAAFLYRYAG